jgi:mTERF domain-containing protein
VLTRAPALLEQDHEDLKTRVAYLISKRFAAEQIAHIVTHAPRWLCFAVKGIDGRLGYFQKTFGLTGIFSLIFAGFICLFFSSFFWNGD